MTLQRHNRWPTWIALFSMLLIFVGPLLTQVQLRAHAEPAHEVSTPSPHHADHRHTDHSHTGLRHHGGSPSVGEVDHSDPLQHLAHGECGYCVLLSKLPALSVRGTRTPSGNLTGPSAAPPHFASLPREVPRFANAPVRAPPVLA